MPYWVKHFLKADKTTIVFINKKVVDESSGQRKRCGPFFGIQKGNQFKKNV